MRHLVDGTVPAFTVTNLYFLILITKGNVHRNIATMWAQHGPTHEE